MVNALTRMRMIGKGNSVLDHNLFVHDPKNQEYKNNQWSYLMANEFVFHASIK